MQVKITIRYIQEVVAEAFSLTPELLRSQRQCRTLCVPRHMAMWLAYELTDQKVNVIAREFGRDPSAMPYALRSINNLRHDRPEVAEAMDAIAARLSGLSADISEHTKTPTEWMQ